MFQFSFLGGRGFPQPLNSIEVLNTRNPKRWRTLSKLTMPSPTFDHCSVALNKTAIMVTGGVGQESQAIILDLKGKKWNAMKPMKQPRRKVINAQKQSYRKFKLCKFRQSLFQHSCIKAKVNGRDGIIVAGGESDAIPDLASLEFFDMNEGNWLSLGRMRQGRRFPGIMTLAGNLVVGGIVYLSIYKVRAALGMIAMIQKDSEIRRNNSCQKITLLL